LNIQGIRAKRNSIFFFQTWHKAIQEKSIERHFVNITHPIISTFVFATLARLAELILEPRRIELAIAFH
jgi:hypothetical protein